MMGLSVGQAVEGNGVWGVKIENPSVTFLKMSLWFDRGFCGLTVFFCPLTVIFCVSKHHGQITKNHGLVLFFDGHWVTEVEP